MSPSPLCFAIGSVAHLWSQHIFPVPASSCDGRILHTDEIDKRTGFVTRTSTHVLATYYQSKYKHRFQLDQFGVAFVGRQSSGVDFKHHSVLILDGGATVHCVANLTLLSNFKRDVPVVRIEGIGGI